MANILAALGAAASSLGVFGQGLAVTQDNVDNATTPGYARQQIFFDALPFVVTGGQSGGVAVEQVQSVRDRFLDFQVVSALQSKTYFDSLSQTLNQVQQNFPLSGNLSVGATMDQFFNSFLALSTSPGDSNLRQQVLQSAQTLATAVHTAYTGLTNERATMDQQASSTVDQINSLSAEVAQLSSERATAPGSAGTNNSATETRLNQVLEQLAGLVNYQEVQQSDGALSLVLPNGTPLVSGTFSFPLRAVPTGPQLQIEDAAGNNVTSGVTGGQLGALLTARNTNIASYLSQLNQLAGTLADTVNEQLAQGHDLAGLAGKPIFQYNSLAFTGSGRAAGTTGAATPAPPDAVTVNFTGGLSGSLTASLNSFFVATAAPANVASGDTVSVNFTSADKATRTSITTAPLGAGDTTATIAQRLNDQVALNPALAGKFTFSDQGGSLKLVESDTAGQGYTFTASTSDPSFTSGLESGGTLGGESAAEIAAALNAQVALNPALAAAGVRFTTAGGPTGQVRLDANVTFTATATDSASGTGFVSGLGGTFTAGGSPAAATFAVTGLQNREIAASGPASAGGNENASAMAQLASSPLVAGFTPGQFYGRLVSQAGQDTSQASTSLDTQKQVLLQAQNLRDSFSGVSLDEEATHLVEFQKAYQATARVITVLGTLADTVIGLIGLPA
ncbi:MAG TPA: flagellar hook-associated protein FlgK [Bryobacterales bacterium]|nr:flagellar hook-associated protein FlgK [Bryobacterales bacterium]